jgi:SAM-dependent methyltransferase
MSSARPTLRETAVSSFEYRSIECPVCEIDDTSFVGMRGGSAHRGGAGERCRVVACRRCGLLYPNPFPYPKDLDALYSAETSYFASYQGWDEVVALRDQIIVSLEEQVKGRRLLDVGAGFGQTIAAARRRGWEAIGIESAARYVEEATRRLGDGFVHGTLDEDSTIFAPHSFDVVTLSGVLEHLHHPNRVLRGVRRVLRPGGILYAEVPNETGLYFAAGNAWCRLNGRDWTVNLSPTFSPFHVLGFSCGSLSALMGKHGFEVRRLKIHAGDSIMKPSLSLRGVLEWAGSRVVHELSRFGAMGAYIECFARSIAGGVG